MANIYIVEFADDERLFTTKEGENVRSQKCVLRDLEGPKYAHRWVAEYFGPMELLEHIGKPIATTLQTRYVEDPVSGVKFTKFQLREIVPISLSNSVTQ